MTSRHRFLGCLLLVLPLAVSAQSDPPCLPLDSVPVTPGTSGIWLTHEGGDAVKAHFWKLAGNARKRWDGASLIIACEIGGPPARDMTAVVVESGGANELTAKFTREYIANLAKNTGHSPQEADVLYNKYAQLSGARYRQVPDDKGGLTNESALIFKRHEKQLGIGAPAAPAQPPGDAKQRAAALKQKMKAAKKRGDMAEMMRLAAEAQDMSAPMAAQTMAVTKQTDQQVWALLQSASSDLAQAAFRTQISGVPGPCLRCTVP